jgi:hypothetical protein
VRTIEPDFLMSLNTSESMLTRRLAFDVEELRRSAGRVEEFDDALVTRNVLSEGTTPTRQLEILCSVPEPVGLRVERLLATELHLSRSRIQQLAKTGDLVAFPQGSNLRRPVRDGMRLVINLAGH